MYLLFSQLDLTCTHALMRVVVLTIIIKWIYPLMIFCSYPLWNWKIWKRETCKLWMWTILALDFETGSRIVAFAFAFLGLCSCVVSESIWHTHTHIQHISTAAFCSGTRANPMRDFQMFKSSAAVHMPNCRCPESIHRRIMSLTKTGQEKKQVPNEGRQCSAWGEDCTVKGGDKCI